MQFSMPRFANAPPDSVVVVAFLQLVNGLDRQELLDQLAVVLGDLISLFRECSDGFPEQSQILLRDRPVRRADRFDDEFRSIQTRHGSQLLVEHCERSGCSTDDTV